MLARLSQVELSSTISGTAAKTQLLFIANKGLSVFVEMIFDATGI